ncbi:hypothetical protein [Flavobacterium aquicola]|uniref:Uncharacterized protein n=1 Tax=Flavobacterium aquicola TaxID=1682742 RepID=A0A3E0EQ66_9FLAO|nr:hypothetical protein [Flavobacterium aquicola]REG99509.1 hypothetical protein C8P67_104127 [Flavobacterium aquicola]
MTYFLEDITEADLDLVLKTGPYASLALLVLLLRSFLLMKSRSQKMILGAQNAVYESSSGAWRSEDDNAVRYIDGDAIVESAKLAEK